MSTAKVFTHGRSQAVRLPKEFRFDADEVAVAKLDDMVILCPRDKAWDVFAAALERFTDDFPADRNQPVGPDSRPDL